MLISRSLSKVVIHASCAREQKSWQITQNIWDTNKLIMNQSMHNPIFCSQFCSLHTTATTPRKISFQLPKQFVCSLQATKNSKVRFLLQPIKRQEDGLSPQALETWIAVLMAQINLLGTQILTLLLTYADTIAYNLTIWLCIFCRHGTSKHGKLHTSKALGAEWKTMLSWEHVHLQKGGSSLAGEEILGHLVSRYCNNFLLDPSSKATHIE